MTRQLENSLDRFVPGQSGTASTASAAVCAVLILAGLIVALAAGQYVLAGLAAVSLAAFGAFFYFSMREKRSELGRAAAEWIEWESAMPEVQRENLRIAIDELSRILESDADAVHELETVYIVAGDLALRQIQQDDGAPLIRHVSVVGVPFDAVYIKEDVLVCADSAFLVSPELRQERVVAMMKKIAAVKRSLEAMKISMNVRLMIVIVTQMPEDEVAKLRDSLSTARFSSTITDVDIRLFDFEELQRTFVSE